MIIKASTVVLPRSGVNADPDLEDGESPEYRKTIKTSRFNPLKPAAVDARRPSDGGWNVAFNFTTVRETNSEKCRVVRISADGAAIHWTNRMKLHRMIFNKAILRR